MKLITKRMMTIVTAAVFAVTAAILFTGCGNDKKTSDPTTATVAATTAAAEQELKTEATQQNTPDSTQQNDDDGTEAYDEYIDQATAVANVRAQAGSGAQIISCEKGYAPDGSAAWVIVVAPVTRDLLFRL